MNNDDFWSGRQAANLANRRAMDDADEAISEWQVHSKKLEARLRNTEQQLHQVKTNYAGAVANVAGLDALCGAMAHELRRVDPGNVVLERQVNIMTTAMQQKFAELGYDYDPITKTLKLKGA